jgi:TatA/E family protein of Tat protein translocase
MFSFHWPELLIIVALAAILFPKRLPGIGAGLGKGIRGFRKSVREIEEQTGVGELKEMGRREARELKELAKVDLSPTPAATSTAATSSAEATPPAAASPSPAPPPEEHRAP